MKSMVMRHPMKNDGICWDGMTQEKGKGMGTTENVKEKSLNWMSAVERSFHGTEGDVRLLWIETILMREIENTGNRFEMDHGRQEGKEVERTGVQDRPEDVILRLNRSEKQKNTKK